MSLEQSIVAARSGVQSLGGNGGGGRETTGDGHMAASHARSVQSCFGRH